MGKNICQQCNQQEIYLHNTQTANATQYQKKKKNKQPNPLTEKWIKKMCYIYTVEYYSAIKRNKKMPFKETCMSLEIVALTKVRQTEKNYDITYMQKQKKVQMKLFTKQKYSHRCRKQVYGY